MKTGLAVIVLLFLMTGCTGVPKGIEPVTGFDQQRYLGTWYEVGSVKQFFSIGLVNTTAQYSLNPDGSIRVENSGNYFVNNGPESRIVGAALPVEGSQNKLNVAFFFGNAELSLELWTVICGISGFDD